MSESYYDLDVVRADTARYQTMHSHPNAFACCSAHAVADHVPALVEELEELRAYAVKAHGEESWRDLYDRYERAMAELRELRPAKRSKD